MMFGDIEPFLRENEDVTPVTRTKLLQFFDDHQKLCLLKLEIAVVVDVYRWSFCECYLCS